MNKDTFKSGRYNVKGTHHEQHLAKPTTETNFHGIEIQVQRGCSTSNLKYFCLSTLTPIITL